MIALTVAGLATATLAATLMTGFAGATQGTSAQDGKTPGTTTATGQNQAPAAAEAGRQQAPVRPATTWYSDWSTWGSGAGGSACDPMALTWC
ncbi:MAG: hypothetical protein ABW215_15560 [Kibdelosporangium sp.]